MTTFLGNKSVLFIYEKLSMTALETILLILVIHAFWLHYKKLFHIYWGHRLSKFLMMNKISNLPRIFKEKLAGSGAHESK